MKKLSQAEWIAVAAGLVVIIGAFYYQPALRFLTERSETNLSEVSSANSVLGVSDEALLMIEDVSVGSGEAVQAGDVILVHYTGRLSDGTAFDSSRGGEPFGFTLGSGQVIAGWDQGLLGMRVGGTRVLTIPPHMGYGSLAVGPIPPNSTLIFEVELVDIVE